MFVSIALGTSSLTLHLTILRYGLQPLPLAVSQEADASLFLHGGTLHTFVSDTEQRNKIWGLSCSIHIVTKVNEYSSYIAFDLLPSYVILTLSESIY